jgi:hypothetical protein
MTRPRRFRYAEQVVVSAKSQSVGEYIDKYPDATPHDVILFWCRSASTQRSLGYMPGMREHGGICRVVALDRTEPKPGSDWERQTIVTAQGSGWGEVLRDLRAKGLVKI